jgi:UPF0176 protein
MQLYNILSAKERATLLEEAGEDRLTLSFYQYAKIGNPELFRNYLFVAWDALEVLGRIYVANEGINAQLSVPAKKFKEFKDFLDSIYFLENCRLNIAVEQDLKSFLKLKVKVRHKIVADGLEDDTFDVRDSGVHLDAQGFNELTSKEDTILIDMRNHYESEVGHFEGAICPDVENFREEVDQVEEMLLGMEGAEVDRPIVMYCTGGIRCEKASAWFKHRGFPNVHQLEGGIIEYVRQVKETGARNKYLGVNFVFDERLAERVSDDVLSNCHLCGTPSDAHTNCANPSCNVLMLQCPGCKEKYDGTCGDTCKAVIGLPEEEQAALRKGKRPAGRHFPKDRRATGSVS